MFNRQAILNTTDANGVVWAQKFERYRAEDGQKLSRDVGKPFKVLDPTYEPDWSAGLISDSDEGLREAMRKVTVITAAGMGLAALGMVFA